MPASSATSTGSLAARRGGSPAIGSLAAHRIKTLHGFHTLLRFIEDSEKRALAVERFGYLMA
jgi:hypothetical protein